MAVTRRNGQHSGRWIDSSHVICEDQDVVLHEIPAVNIDVDRAENLALTPALTTLILAEEESRQRFRDRPVEIDAMHTGTLAAAIQSTMCGPLHQLLILKAGRKAFDAGIQNVLAECVDSVHGLYRADLGDLLARHQLEGAGLPECFDAIVLADPGWGACALDALGVAQHRLRDGGMLVVIGLARQEPRIDGRDDGASILPYLQAQGRRCGFDELHTLDLSSVADAALTAARETGMQSADVIAAREALLVEGTIFGLAWCRKIASPRWSLRTLDSRDAQRMRALFDDVFAPNAMSEAHWRWKYEAGHGCGVAAWHRDRMVAFYGGLPRTIRFKGRSAVAMQIVDVMVQAAERGILRRQGAFFQTASSFLECYVGRGSDALIGYGFPTSRALEVARRLGLYETVGEVRELSWPCCETAESWTRSLQVVTADTLPKHARTVDRLWYAMDNSLAHAIVGIRDWAFIRHRFVEHPDKTYRYLLLRLGLTRRIVALIVLSIQDDTCHLRDYVGQPRHLTPTIDLLRGYAASHNLKQVKTWITSGYVHAFPEEGRADHPLDLFIPHSTCTFGPTLAEIDGHWWLMGGDTDFL